MYIGNWCHQLHLLNLLARLLKFDYLLSVSITSVGGPHMSFSKLSNTQPIILFVFCSHLSPLRTCTNWILFRKAGYNTEWFLVISKNTIHLTLPFYDKLFPHKLFATTILAKLPAICTMKTRARRVWGRWGGYFLRSDCYSFVVFRSLPEGSSPYWA